MTFRRTTSRRLIAPSITALLLASTAVITTEAPVAHAATGDASYAFGQFLQGNLLGRLTTTQLADVAGEEAEIDGAADPAEVEDGPNFDNLDVTALQAIELGAAGGIQLPLDNTELGVVGQYAYANDDGFSAAAAGAVTELGAIGTPDDAQYGPMNLSLASLLDDLGLPPTSLDGVTALDLSVDGAAATATLQAPTTVTRSYNIDDIDLAIASPAVADVVDGLDAVAADLDAELATLQTDIANALLSNIAVILGGLPVLSSTVTVSGLDDTVTEIVNGLTTGTLSDPACPNVEIDLDAGTIDVALDEIVELNGRAPNTVVFPDDGTTLLQITESTTCLLEGLLENASTAINAALADITITGGINLLGSPILTLNTSVGALLDSNPANDGVTLLGALGISTPTAVLAPVRTILTNLQVVPATLQSQILTPIVTDVLPDFEPVLEALLRLTVNVQQTAAGQFTERALRVELVPGSTTLPGVGGVATLNLANAVVGPNAIGAPVIDGGSLGIVPNNGPESGGTSVVLSGANFTGATTVTLDDTDVDIVLVPYTNGNPSITERGEFIVTGDDSITFVTPANEPGPVNVTVAGPGGTSNGVVFTFTPGASDDPEITGIDPDNGPESGNTTVTLTGVNFTGANAVTIADDDEDVVFEPMSSGYPTLLEMGEFEVDSDTTITMLTPSNEPGAVGVTVTAPTGTSNPAAFTFTPLAGPGIDEIIPDHGPDDGGDPNDDSTWVTIIGSCFTGATDVTFGGVSALSFTVVSDNQITAVPPAHVPATVDVVVVGTTGCGDLTRPDGYIYDSDPPLDAARFIPIEPCRLLDTREGDGVKPTASSTRMVQVTNRCNVPAEAIAASFTVTETEAENVGFVTVWPEGAQPTVSNLNYSPGETRANGSVVRLSTTGSVQLFTLASAHLVVDVSGVWVRSGAVDSGRFVAATPTRLLDTREPGGSAFGVREQRVLPLPVGVPADATALAINLTLPDSVGPTYMAAYPASATTVPTVSAVNADGPNQFRAASLIVPVSAQGFTLFSLAGGHAVVDYLGYFTGETAQIAATGLFVPQSPDRVIDTRLTAGPIAGNTSIDVNTEVPGSGIVANVTLVDTSGPNFLTVWPSGITRPGTSSVNAVSEPAVANLAIVGQTNSTVSVYSLVDAHAIIDVAGYFFE